MPVTKESTHEAKPQWGSGEGRRSGRRSGWESGPRGNSLSHILMMCVFLTKEVKVNKKKKCQVPWSATEWVTLRQLSRNSSSPGVSDREPPTATHWNKTRAAAPATRRQGEGWRMDGRGLDASAFLFKSLSIPSKFFYQSRGKSYK